MDWLLDLLIDLAAVAALLLLLLFLIKPARPRAERERFRGLRVAHRGLHGGGVPENSLAAFRAARAADIAVELDVRLTKDGQVVVFHDDTLRRMCGEDIRVDALTLDELAVYRLAGTGERIPLFSDVLAALGGVPLICEVKQCPAGRRAELCEKTAGLLDGYAGDKCMESFDPRLVRWFKKNRPALVRGQLAQNFLKRREGLSLSAALLVTCLFSNVLARPDFIAWNWRDDSLGFRVCRRLFHPLCVAWTARGPEEEAAVPASFDTVIFETKPRKVDNSCG